jgi:hypothetical protein
VAGTEIAPAEQPSPQDQEQPASSVVVERTPIDPFIQIGGTGLKEASGFIFEEYLPVLRGLQGIRTYQEMSQNDAVIGAVLSAISLMIRAVDWKVTAADDTPAAQAEAEYVDSLFTDMDHTFEDFLAEALSMLPFGWAYHEIVFKIRGGPYETDPRLRSKYDDGRIGIRKLPIRSQDSLLRWEFGPNNDLLGMHQLLPTGGSVIFIPIQKALHFRTTSRKDSPEGVSMLRNAYRSWYFKKTIDWH